MSLPEADKKRIAELVEASKDDRTIIVGSDIREMSMFIQKLEKENEKLREEVKLLKVNMQLRDGISAGIQRTHEHARRVFEAAVKNKIVYNIGACGNGGIPTWEAVCDKIVEACERIGSKSVL